MRVTGLNQWTKNRTMDDNVYFAIKEKAKEASRLNGACKNGYHDLLLADSMGKFCCLLEKYWNDVIGMHLSSTLEILEEVYETNKNDFNKHDIYYNENCASGKVIVNGKSVAVTGNAIAWVYNHGVIQAKGRSVVHLYDTSEAHLSENASVFAYGKSTVNAMDFSSVRAANNSKITLNGRVEAVCGEDCEVIAYRWRKITASGNSKIYAGGRKNVILFDNAILLNL